MLNDHQRATPVKQPVKQYEHSSDSCIGRARCGVALLVHGPLLAQKQVLSGKRALRTQAKPKELGHVAEQFDYDVDTVHDVQYYPYRERMRDVGLKDAQ